MAYEVWSTVARSVLGGYETEEAALAAVRAALARYGRVYADGLALLYEDRAGRSRLVADGAELARRALMPSTSGLLAPRPSRRPGGRTTGVRGGSTEPDGAARVESSVAP
jgi:hypothetical protein